MQMVDLFTADDYPHEAPTPDVLHALRCEAEEEREAADGFEMEVGLPAPEYEPAEDEVVMEQVRICWARVLGTHTVHI